MGNLYRHHKLLLDASDGLTETTEGNAWKLRPSSSDAQPDHLHTFAIVFEPGESEGTVVPSVQTSWDGEHWLDVATGTTKGAKTMKASVLGRFIRGSVTVEGEALYAGTIRLISDAPFRLV